MNVMLIAEATSLNLVYPPQVLAKLPEGVALVGDRFEASDGDRIARLAAEVDVLLTTWGTPTLDDRFLEAMPRLRAVLYGAGSVKNFVTDAVWDRGIHVCSSWELNGFPAAEMSFAMIVLSLKGGFSLARRVRREKSFPSVRDRGYIPSLNGSTVGLVSYGMIGRAVRERLAHLNLNVLVYDPFLTDEQAEAARVRRVGLDELFRVSDVISVHTPWLPDTEGLIQGHHFEALKPGATVINTSRGVIIRENEMIDVLLRRSDIDVLLDVTRPEPPVPDSPLYTLPNVWLTPHIAGSVGRECESMGEAMIEELGRLLRNEPLQREVTRAMVATMA